MDEIVLPEGQEVQPETTAPMKKAHKQNKQPIRWTQVVEVQAALDAGTYQINYEELASKILKPKAANKNK